MNKLLDILTLIPLVIGGVVLIWIFICWFVDDGIRCKKNVEAYVEGIRRGR